MKYDIVIIGAGAAGISAGIYAKSRGKKVLILEKNQVGGIIGNVSTVTHYSGIIENETGESFARRMKFQALAAGIQILKENVVKAALKQSPKIIETDKNTYEADAVIIANGSSPRNLGIPGEKEWSGRGMDMNAARDGKKYSGKNVYVVGGADGAVKEAIYLSQYAKKVTIIHFEEALGCIAEFKEKIAYLGNVNVWLQTRLSAVNGSDCVDEFEILHTDTGRTEWVKDQGCGIFVYAGLVPNTELYSEELTLNNGWIPVNDRMETELEGVYAAGDIRVKQVRQVATAVADGSIAAINACAYLAGKAL